MEKEYKSVERQGFVFVLLRTKRFGSLMDKLGSYRIAKPVGWILLYLMPVAAAFALYLFLTDLGVLLSPRGSSIAHVITGLGPLANLGLPGLNPYLPFVDGWIALVIGLVLHEGAHGVIARSLGLPVKSSGLIFLLFVPIGAFVEVDEDALKTARARDSGRVLGAGAGTNLVLAMASLLLLLFLVSQMVPATNGIGITSVTAPSPAYAAGIRAGDFMTAVNGVQINDPQQIANSSWYRPSGIINVTIWRQGTTMQMNKIQLENITFYNQRGFLLGVNDVSNANLRAHASNYAGSLFTSPVTYLCIPTFSCGSTLPFGGYSPFYTSAIGPSVTAIANLFYWIFFLNLNLAIFNALPIYPLDGGQAFLVGVKALGKGRITEKTALRVTQGVTLGVAGLFLSILIVPYFL